MKFIMLIGEYALGILVLILDLFAILLGLLIGLTELPRYLRYKQM